MFEEGDRLRQLHARTTSTISRSVTRLDRRLRDETPAALTQDPVPGMAQVHEQRRYPETRRAIAARRRQAARAYGNHVS